MMIYYTLIKKGVLKYHIKANKFLKDTILSALFIKEDYTSGRLIFNEETNTLWCFSKKDLNYISPDKLSNTPKINKIPFFQVITKRLNRLRKHNPF